MHCAALPVHVDDTAPAFELSSTFQLSLYLSGLWESITATADQVVLTAANLCVCVHV